ncbi:MAG: hypothetical protein ACOYN0_10045 [Phycisphaerales bacterium]
MCRPETLALAPAGGYAGSMQSPALCRLVILATTLPPAAIAEPAPQDPPGQNHIVVFAHYGDLNQQYDPVPGGEDRRSSYELSNPGFASGGWEHADTDNPRAPGDRAYPFVLRGYDGFDPRTLVNGTIRFDVRFVDVTCERWNLELFDLAGSSIVHMFFGAGLRECLEAAGHLREQWVAMSLDLVSGELSAQEIDAFGCPIAGRSYGRVMIGIEQSGFEPRALGRELASMLDSAKGGVLSGLLSGGVRASFVSVNLTALPPGPDPLRLPRSASERKGWIREGNPGSLGATDDQSLIFVPERESGSYVFEFDSEFVIGGSLRESATGGAMINVAASVSGGIPGVLTIEAIKPGTEDLIRLHQGALGTSGKNPTAFRVALPDWRALLNDDGSLRLRLRGTRKLVLTEGAGVAALLPNIADRPEFRVELLTLKFSVPTIDPSDPTPPPKPGDADR